MVVFFECCRYKVENKFVVEVGDDKYVILFVGIVMIFDILCIIEISIIL